MKVQRMVKFDGKSSLKAYCDVEVNGLTIKGVRVIEGKQGLLVSMPRTLGKDGCWYDTVMVNVFTKPYLTDAVLQAYRQEVPLCYA